MLHECTNSFTTYIRMLCFDLFPPRKVCVHFQALHCIKHAMSDLCLWSGKHELWRLTFALDDNRGDGGAEAAGRRLPHHPPLLVLHQRKGQPVGHHDQGGDGGRHAASSTWMTTFVLYRVERKILKPASRKLWVWHFEHLPSNYVKMQTAEEELSVHWLDCYSPVRLSNYI